MLFLNLKSLLYSYRIPVDWTGCKLQYTGTVHHSELIFFHYNDPNPVSLVPQGFPAKKYDVKVMA
jgi:hypothetical protein